MPVATGCCWSAVNSEKILVDLACKYIVAGGEVGLGGGETCCDQLLWLCWMDIKKLLNHINNE